MDNLKKSNKQKKKIKLIIVNMIFIMILAVGIIKSETMNIGVMGVNAANTTYDINKPNTWPTGTEISFGNNVYGVRKTGALTVAYGTKTDVQILTTSGVSSILAHGGSWKANGGRSMAGPGTVGGCYFSSWYSGTGTTPNNTLYITFTPCSAMTNDAYNFWILYTK